MNRKLVLSRRASANLEKLLEYLEKRWSLRVRDNFIKKLDRALNILKDKPGSSQKSETINGLHKCVITKQTIAFYKFDSERIYITTIFDTRQDPKKIKKEIRE